MRQIVPGLMPGFVARCGLLLISIMSLPLAAQTTNAGGADIVPLVKRIQRADYEGNRVELNRLYDALAPFTGGSRASRVHYWRGFAKWRRALNGFNDSVDPAEITADLTQALAAFEQALESDPRFSDARIAAASCLGNLIFLNQSNPDKVRDLVTRSSALLREAAAADPENPRLFWVRGPTYWWMPAERGGGQGKAMETYEKGLAAVANAAPPAHPLDPSWGKPELLMNLAWSCLNRSQPDLAKARDYARQALELVPYWHYVRDILVPQIEAAAKRAN